jgi:molybdenum cofactor synthesis domain-containing protein
LQPVQAWLFDQNLPGQIMDKAPESAVTAGFVVIGDEILSGRTKDKNIGTVADFCTDLGIDLREVRVVADERSAIVEAIRALSARYTYVFTSGGIGPTHDDITAESVAAAFDLEIEINPEARLILEERFGTKDISPGRLLMARVPRGGTLIGNSVSGAPGFIVGNVYVMAGVPRILEAMLEDLSTKVRGGRKLLSRSIDCRVGESVVAAGLGALQKAYPGVKIGSYPQLGRMPVYTQLVLRAADADLLERATADVQALVDRLHAEHKVDL